MAAEKVVPLVMVAGTSAPRSRVTLPASVSPTFAPGTAPTAVSVPVNCTSISWAVAAATAPAARRKTATLRHGNCGVLIMMRSSSGLIG